MTQCSLASSQTTLQLVVNSPDDGPTSTRFESDELSAFFLRSIDSSLRTFSNSKAEGDIPAAQFALDDLVISSTTVVILEVIVVLTCRYHTVDSSSPA